MCIPRNKIEIMIELRTDYNVYLIFDETLTLTILIIGKILQETKKHLYNMCTTSAQRLQRWSNIVQMGERGNFRLPAQRGHTRKSIKYTLIGSSQHQ